MKTSPMIMAHAHAPPAVDLEVPLGAVDRVAVELVAPHEFVVLHVELAGVDGLAESSSSTREGDHRELNIAEGIPMHIRKDARACEAF